MGLRYRPKPQCPWWWYHRRLFLSWLYGKPFSCGTKDNFKHYARALAVRDKMILLYHKPFTCYPCWWCGGWHVGRDRGVFNPLRFRWYNFIRFRILFPLLGKTPPVPKTKTKSSRKSR